MNYEFIDEDQKQFFEKNRSIAELNTDYAALVYTLGLTAATRSGFKSLYNAERREINPDVVFRGYWSSGERAVVRLAFLLFTYCPVHDDDIGEYTPKALLCSVDGKIKRGMLKAMEYFA